MISDFACLGLFYFSVSVDKLRFNREFSGFLYNSLL